MPPSIGFALLTHNQPEQTAYLCHKLSAMFDHPPIAIHHDYSKCPLDPATLPKHVKIVSHWVRTGWGNAAVIDGYMAALRLLHAHDAPEWTVSMSSTDYPIHSAESILRDLSSSSADGLMDYREIYKGAAQPRDARSMAAAFQRPEYMELAYTRYLSFSLNPKVFWRRLDLHSLFRADGHATGTNPLTQLVRPFSSTFRCFAGDWWHTLRRSAVAVLLEDTPQSRRLRRYYETRPSPEESYYQTLLVNRGLRIDNDNHRFTLWRGDNPHPELLGYDTIDAMVSSSAHFARKFPFDRALLAAIDEAVAAAQR